MKYWLQNIRYGIPNFFRNVWVQRKALWEARSWDYHGLLLYMINQIAYMEKEQREANNHVETDRCCDQMKVCVFLLDRLLRDEYDIERFNFVDAPGHGLFNMKIEPRYSFPKKRLNKISQKQKQIDKEYLFKLMAKYVDHWWS